MALSFTIAAGLAIAVILGSESRGFYYLRFEIPPTWRARSLYLYPTGTGRLSYRQTIPLYSCSTDHATQKTYHMSECVSIGSFPSIGHDADHTENTSSVVRLHVSSLLSTGHGTDNIENTSSNTLSVVARISGVA
jgi:hypothetical protein